MCFERKRMQDYWLLLFHGLGGDRTSLVEVADYFKHQIANTETVVLQGPINFGTDSCPAYGWFEPPADRHRALDDPSRQLPNGLSRSVDYVHVKIRELTAGGVSPENIHLIGHSQGGAAAITSGLLYNGRLGSVSTIAGYLSLDTSMAPTLNETHYHLHHSLHDDNVSVKWVHYAKEYIEAVGCPCDARCWDLRNDPHGIHKPQIEVICHGIQKHISNG